MDDFHPYVMPGPVGELMAHSNRFFGPDSANECDMLERLYTGRARQLVKTHLRGLGLGIADDPYPVDAGGLLGFVVEQLAVAYRSPAERRLKLGDTALEDEDPQQKAMVETYERMGVDAKMKRFDIMRTLMRTYFIRAYPSDRSRMVRLVGFSPCNVWRHATPGESADTREDERIALRREDNSFELWKKQGPDSWSVEVYDHEGNLKMAPENWDTLPIMAMYDGDPDAPYMLPPQYRVPYSLKAAAIHNEMMCAIKWDTHPRATYESVVDSSPRADPTKRSKPPKNVGPGQAANLPPGMSLRLHQIQPQIQAISAAYIELVQSWLEQESLPPTSFRKSQSVSAIAIEALSQPLRERREAMAPFASQEESQLWEMVRGVHNEFADKWGVSSLPEAEMTVKLGRIDVPMDPTQRAHVMAQLGALKLASRVTMCMEQFGLNRAAALRYLEQIDDDNKKWGVAETTPEVGRNLADQDPEDPNPDASTTQKAAQEMSDDGREREPAE